MPDSQPVPGGDFARHQRQLGKWLRQYAVDVRSLVPDEIQQYKCKNIVAGWQIRIPDSGRQFLVLLNDCFPYSRIQIAYVGDDHYMEWPHVEENNFLCLPDEGWRPCEDLEYSIAQRLQKANDLVTNCQSDDYLRSESEREFLTYWGRQKDKLTALSIIDTKDARPRKIAAKAYRGNYIIGESDDQLQGWLENSGVDGTGKSIQAVFALVNEPPALPLPKSGRQFVRQLLNQAPNNSGLITALSPFKTTLVVLATRSVDGVALFGGKLHAAPKNGFRDRPTPKLLRRIWSSACRYSPMRVNRADSAWIHGRDQDTEGHQTLSSSRVVMIGGGSLGSQVSARLAQVGVGQIDIVDPENLEPCNVGRHALGMESVHSNKASSLASVLRARYPHANFGGFESRWQEVLRDRPDIFHQADIVVSCVGEVEQDLSWDSWHQSGALRQTPTVYGWLGTQGTTGHALALKAGGPALSCYFDPDGFLKSPDTEFTGGSQIRAEPACGTEFQPYGPLAAGQTELLVTRAVIDTLTGRVTVPFHRVYACSTEDLVELGGIWTDHHRAIRPEGYEGPFEYSPAVERCNDCHNCQ